MRFDRIVIGSIYMTRTYSLDMELRCAQLRQLSLGFSLHTPEERRECSWCCSRTVSRDIDETEGLICGWQGGESLSGSDREVSSDGDIFSVACCQSNVMLFKVTKMVETNSFVTLSWLIPNAQTTPLAPCNCSRTLGSYFVKSLWIIVLTLESFSAKGTGLLLKMEILVISFDFSIASKTLEPTRPVAPVRMRCMIL